MDRPPPSYDECVAADGGARRRPAHAAAAGASREAIRNAVRTLDDVAAMRYADFAGFDVAPDASEYGFHLVFRRGVVRFKHKTATIELLEPAEHEYSAQTFALGELQKNILRNALVPTHEPSADCFFVGKHPRILASDPVCRLLGVRAGRLKITRNDGDDEYVYYRDVCAVKE